MCGRNGGRLSFKGSFLSYFWRGCSYFVAKLRRASTIALILLGMNLTLSGQDLPILELPLTIYPTELDGFRTDYQLMKLAILQALADYQIQSEKYWANMRDNLTQELTKLKAENDTIKLNLTLAEGAADVAEKALEDAQKELFAWKVGAVIGGAGTVLFGVLYLLK